MRGRALLAGVALAVALVAYPKPVAESVSVRGSGAARMPAPWSSGLDVELVANGDAAEAWPSRETPPGWAAVGLVERTVTPDGQTWFEAPDGWFALSQRLVLPSSIGPVGRGEPGGPRLEVLLAARFGPGARGSVQLFCEAGGPDTVPDEHAVPSAPGVTGRGGTGQFEGAGQLELTQTGERRAPLPAGARTAVLVARLTGSASRDVGAGAGATGPRLTGVSIRVVRAE